MPHCGRAKASWPSKSKVPIFSQVREETIIARDHVVALRAGGRPGSWETREGRRTGGDRGAHVANE
jgi:hypothetical protein